MSTTTAPGAGRLTVLHARYLVLEALRTPIAVIGTAFFPALALLFFVVPQSAVADDPPSATAAAAQLSMFAVISVCLFSFGAAVAEDRSLPWDPYLRTLPAGATPRILGRLLTGLVFALIGIAPVVVIAALLTAATLTPAQAVLGLAALVGGAVPFLGIGLALGYSLSPKAAVPIAQVILFPMAFAGGLFLPPETFPAWLDTISRLLPSRAGRDLVVAAVGSGDLALESVLVLVVWAVLGLGLAGWAYRRDEGRRFR